MNFGIRDIMACGAHTCLYHTKFYSFLRKDFLLSLLSHCQALDIIFNTFFFKFKLHSVLTKCTINQHQYVRMQAYTEFLHAPHPFPLSLYNKWTLTDRYKNKSKQQKQI